MYENFQSRVLQTLASLRGLAMTEEWNITLQVWSDEHLSLYFNTHTPDYIKRLLDTDGPPTFDELKAADWIETTNAGVYARLIWPTSEVSHRHVYVGSATSIRWIIQEKDRPRKPSNMEKAVWRTRYQNITSPNNGLMPPCFDALIEAAEGQAKIQGIASVIEILPIRRNSRSAVANPETNIDLLANPSWFDDIENNDEPAPGPKGVVRTKSPPPLQPEDISA
ncbi:hypothetical protein DTO271G3_6771 [Paecilomyces variotii]|nr:hypothetical protein DTO271G3_6771 [Paecilomyces variotii]